MRTILFVNHLFLILALLESGHQTASPKSARALGGVQRSSVVPRLTVTLKAANEATILFNLESDEDTDAPDSSGQKIPHLVLKRNGVLTPGFERTLLLSLDNLAVPPGGLYARLTLETQHSDPDLGRGHKNRFSVWEETRFLPYSGYAAQLTAVNFNVVFEHFFKHEGKAVQTPTDYYRYELSVFDPQGHIVHEISEEFAFLIENQWRVPLPRVLEATPGAAPNELLIYYYDMIPFQTDMRDPETQIPRQDVNRYIQTELIPALVQAFVTQSTLWDLPWYEEWSNYRTEEDPQTLSVALGGYGLWFHGAAPSLGHAMISIRVDGSFGEYSSLTDGILSVFHHELFHNQQRNISLHFGSKGNLYGKDGAWKLFSEGTAVLASLVGQPDVQFAPSSQLRAYMKRANSFIGTGDGISGSLNKSYRDVPYHMALYWRFLYENCGGIQNGVEDPATGMKIIRTVLETVYSGTIVDINASTDVAQSMPRILDAALQATSDCRFQTYEESLVEFARAIYLLRLEDGRCPAIENMQGCGFFDPYKLYNTPSAEEHIMKAGAATLINGAIPSSYGIDLLEFRWDPAAQAKSIQIIIDNISDPAPEFSVELWKIAALDEEGNRESGLSSAGQPKLARTQNGSITIQVSAAEMDDFTGLGLVITRIDPYEKPEVTGDYTIRLIVK